jgi:hypothetical protein
MRRTKISWDEESSYQLTHNSNEEGSLNFDPFNRPRGGVALNNLPHQLTLDIGQKR